VQLNDILIKKGTLVSIDLASTMTNPKYYSDPYEFKPERWLGNEEID